MRITALIAILAMSISVGAVAYFFLYVYVPPESPGMGRGTGPQFYIWVPIVAMPLTFAVALLSYLALFPEIKQVPETEPAMPQEQRTLAAVMRVLKDDERKVVERLVNAGGKMLQKDIARQMGFSRVKTHRILYRLSVRGVVIAKKYYNTYEIMLADWLR